MRFERTPIDGLFIVEMTPHTDERGWFARTFCKREFKEYVGLDINFVQLNQSYNKRQGTFRGMHYQIPPFAEIKLVRCVTGAVIDFVVDVRRDSPTFLKSFQTELSAKNGRMVLIPQGLAHGFITLADETNLLYHHTEYHAPASERGIHYQDPLINITVDHPIRVISERDRSYAMLPKDFEGVKF